MQRHPNPPRETSEHLPNRLPLWTGGDLPLGIDLPQVQGAHFRLIKDFEPKLDGNSGAHVGDWLFPIYELTGVPGRRRSLGRRLFGVGGSPLDG